MHDVVKNLGEKIFWRVLMKPGAPVIGWKTEKFLGLALSGNPFAAFATFELLARFILRLSVIVWWIFRRGLKNFCAAMSSK